MTGWSRASIILVACLSTGLMPWLTSCNSATPTVTPVAVEPPPPPEPPAPPPPEPPPENPPPPPPPPAPSVASIVLSPASGNLEVGGAALTLASSIKDSNSNPMDPAPTLTWKAVDSNKVNISSTGQVTGLATGTVTVTASVGTVTSNEVRLTIRDERLHSISVQANTTNILVGANTTLTATARNRDGVALTNQPTFTWASSNTSILTVNAQGKATGATPGNANVTASTSGVTSNAVSLEVKSPPGPHQIGQWSSVMSWPALAIHATLMPDGSVVTFGWRKTDPYTGYDPNHGPNEAQTAQPSTLVDRWNPTTNAHTTTWETNVDMFGAGHDLLEDGRLFVSGGTAVGVNPDWKGIKDNFIFNSGTGNWSAAAKMQYARWYPSTTTLPNGEVLITEGIDAQGQNVGTPEVWNPTNNTWRTLTTATQSLDYAYYPFMHVTPNGRVFKAGPKPGMGFLETQGSGQWTSVANRDGTFRQYGSSVPYTPGKVLVVGGGTPDATNTAVIVDLNTGNTTNTGSMKYARRNLNAVLLPDGTVLAVGGNLRNNDEGNLPLAAERWNPSTGQWTELASMSVARPYHSTALLLPDGRVFSAGGYDNYQGMTTYRNAQIFSPPYLFKPDGSGQPATRPTISSAPTSIGYNASFDVPTPNAAGINKVAMIRLGSSTHAFDFSQRYLPLEFTQDTNTLHVTSPQNANLATPGHYMLFIINAQGVPSTAKIIKLER